MKINILGSDYELIYRGKTEDPKLSEADGYCEVYAKEIVDWIAIQAPKLLEAFGAAGAMACET